MSFALAHPPERFILRSMHFPDDERFMRAALREAEEAFARGEVPVGCVVVVGGEIVGAGHNRVEELCDPTAHAELFALRAAAKTLGNWRLERATVYVTLEPCPMCTAAMILARVERIVFGAANRELGACGTVWNLTVDPAFDHHPPALGGILAEEAQKLMRAFFERLRGRGG